MRRTESNICPGMLKHLSVYFLLIVLFYSTPLLAQDYEWLPRSSSYPTPVFDPRATINGISMLNYDVEGEEEQVAYVPVTLSMEQQFIRFHKAQNRLWELGMSFSIYAQWSIVDVGEAFLGGLQNTDYRISGIATYRWDPNHHLRFSLFHQSSHLGDDYIIRNNITRPALRTLNFEQIDVNYSRKINAWHMYLGTGFNVSPNTVRGRSMFQVGFEHLKSLTGYKGVAMRSGINVNIHEQNDFSPNLRLALGVEVGRNTQTPFILLVSAFSGHLPYSTLEYQKVRLIGLSLIIPLH